LSTSATFRKGAREQHRLAQFPKREVATHLVALVAARAPVAAVLAAHPASREEAAGTDADADADDDDATPPSTMLATMNNNALLTLDALAGCGVVLPAEIRASLDVSLALKASELGVREFFLWGRVRTQSGTDYYVARAENGKRVDHDGVVVANVGAKFYYSQDGMEWLDLVPPEEDVTMEKAAELKCASSSVDRSRVLDLFSPASSLRIRRGSFARRTNVLSRERKRSISLVVVRLVVDSPDPSIDPGASV